MIRRFNLTGGHSFGALAAAAVVALAASSTNAHAQTITTTPPALLWACYVPTTGTVYRIKTPDTRDACVAANHVEFSWNQIGPQGPQGPNLIPRSEEHTSELQSRLHLVC